MTSMTDAYKIKKQDWIILRLLFTLMAGDASVTVLPDIQKTINYLKDRYRWLDSDIIAVGFTLLKREHAKEGTFYDKPDCKLVRNMDGTVDKGFEDTVTPVYMQWRFNDE